MLQSADYREIHIRLIGDFGAVNYAFYFNYRWKILYDTPAATPTAEYLLTKDIGW